MSKIECKLADYNAEAHLDTTPAADLLREASHENHEN